jgi:hypothetical protein
MPAADGRLVLNHMMVVLNARVVVVRHDDKWLKLCVSCATLVWWLLLASAT